MADPIRALLRELLDFAVLCDGLLKGEGLWDDDSECDGGLLDRARATLAAEPPAPDPREALAARPLLEAVARLGGCIGQHTVGEITTISDRAAAWLRENPPGQPVAIEPRGCPTPGACSCVEPPAPAEPDTDAVLTLAHLRRCPAHGQLPANAWACPECLRELREELARFKAPAADGEHEELAQWLDWLLPAFHREHDSTHASNCLRAAALLREARPQPVPVADRPWERPGWCDAQGRCWWFAPTEAISGGFRCAGWSLYAADPADEDTHCLPHWAIPVPANPTETTTTGDQ